MYAILSKQVYDPASRTQTPALSAPNWRPTKSCTQSSPAVHFRGQWKRAEMQAICVGWENINLNLTAEPSRNCTEAAKPGIYVSVPPLERNKRYAAQLCALNVFVMVCEICIRYAYCVRTHAGIRASCTDIIWRGLFQPTALDLSVFTTGCCSGGESSAAEASVKLWHRSGKRVEQSASSIVQTDTHSNTSLHI